MYKVNQNRQRLLKLPIAKVFSAFRMQPVSHTAGYSQYETPFRESHAPSLFVNHGKNYWYDTGMKHTSGRVTVCGNAVDFINASMIDESHCGAYDILAKIEAGQEIKVDLSHATVFQERLHTLPQLPEPLRKSSVHILETSKTIADSGLVSLLNKKHIPLELASEYCCEGIVEQNGLIRSVDRFILFPNASGGDLAINYWETRSVGALNVSLIKGIADGKCYLFTHLFDYLAYRTLYGRIMSDVIICNNNANFDKAIFLAARYRERRIFLRHNSSENLLMSKIQSHHWQNTEITIGAFDCDSFEEYLETKKI